MPTDCVGYACLSKACLLGMLPAQPRTTDHLTPELPPTQANAQLKADVEQLRSLPSPLVLAQQRRAECIADRSKFEAVIENQGSTKASLAKKLAERNADVAARKQQLAEVLKVGASGWQCKFCSML